MKLSSEIQSNLTYQRINWRRVVPSDKRASLERGKKSGTDDLIHCIQSVNATLFLIFRKMNSIFRPFPNRFTELAEYIDKSSVKELEILYPKLINEIFNSNVKINWGLRTSKLGDNYCSFQAAFDFLSPNGPIFRLCYKLLLDCHLRYEFPYQHLPVSYFIVWKSIIIGRL